MKRIILCCFVCLMSSCEYFFQLDSDTILVDKIKKEIQKENTIINFSSLTNFDWDNLIILGPYTSIEDIEKEFELNLTNIEQNGIAYSDYYNLIVFIENSKSVKIIEIENVFSPQRILISKEDSLFKLESDGIITALKE